MTGFDGCTPLIRMENDDAMQVIRHDDEGIDFDGRPDQRRPFPFLSDYAPHFVQLHAVWTYIAE